MSPIITPFSHHSNVRYMQLLRALATLLQLNPMPSQQRALLDRIAVALNAFDDRFQLHGWTPTLDDLEHLYHVHLVHEPTKRPAHKQPYGCRAYSSDGEPRMEAEGREANSLSDDSGGSDSSAETTAHHPLSATQLSAVIVGTVLTYITWASMEMLHRLIREVYSFFQEE